MWSPHCGHIFCLFKNVTMPMKFNYAYFVVVFTSERCSQVIFKRPDSVISIFVHCETNSKFNT